MAVTIQHLRGTAAQWAALNPVLKPGELGFEKDTKIIKLGDGVTAWNDLDLGYLRKAGGTMTGALSLPQPTLDAHAARKLDVDTAKAAVAKGQVGYAELASDQGGVTTEVAVNNLSVTYVVPANRRIKVSFRIRAYYSGAHGDEFIARIKDNGSTIQTAYSTFGKAYLVVLDEIIYTPSAASHTWTITWARQSGTGTYTMLGNSATNKTYMVVEDCGPA